MKTFDTFILESVEDPELSLLRSRILRSYHQNKNNIKQRPTGFIGEPPVSKNAAAHKNDIILVSPVITRKGPKYTHHLGNKVGLVFGYRKRSQASPIYFAAFEDGHIYPVAADCFRVLQSKAQYDAHLAGQEVSFHYKELCQDPTYQKYLKWFKELGYHDVQFEKVPDRVEAYKVLEIPTWLSDSEAKSFSVYLVYRKGDFQIQIEYPDLDGRTRTFIYGIGTNYSANINKVCSFIKVLKKLSTIKNSYAEIVERVIADYNMSDTIDRCNLILGEKLHFVPCFEEGDQWNAYFSFILSKRKNFLQALRQKFPNITLSIQIHIPELQPQLCISPHIHVIGSRKTKDSVYFGQSQVIKTIDDLATAIEQLKEAEQIYFGYDPLQLKAQKGLNDDDISTLGNI